MDEKAQSAEITAPFYNQDLAAVILKPSLPCITAHLDTVSK